MGTIVFLILFPMIVAFILLVVKGDKGRDVIVIGASAIIAAMSIVVAIQFASGGGDFFSFNGEVIGYIMMAVEAGLCIYICITAAMHRKWLAFIFAIIQTPLIMWFEFSRGHGIEVESNLYVDRLSIIMILIIGIIGTLIAVYALGYMKDFQHHEDEKGNKDRRPWFFFVMFLFLGAMVGLVTSNNMIWMYFFWEITSLSSFWLIGYTKTEEATNNAFRALIMNLLGGLGFAVGIVILGVVFQTLELSTMLLIG